MGIGLPGVGVCVCVWGGGYNKTYTDNTIGIIIHKSKIFMSMVTYNRSVWRQLIQLYSQLECNYMTPPRHACMFLKELA